MIQASSINECVTLTGGVQIPCVGFGTYKTALGNTAEVIRMALEAGYRSLDSASFYGTEPYIAQALADSGIDRKDVFLTSKLWRTEMGYTQTKEAFQRTLDNLKTDYLDLYLIHWPRPSRAYADWKQLDTDTWRAMEELYQEGKIRAIGVSNFLPQHLDNLLEHCTVAPMVDQLEFHPGYMQAAAVSYCQAHGIQVEAWSPLGRTRVLQDPLILELAAKYGVSAAQLCLRYALEKDVIPLPKASSPERMMENQNVFSFEMEREDIYRIDTMPQTGWSGEHPDLVP